MLEASERILRHALSQQVVTNKLLLALVAAQPNIPVSIANKLAEMIDAENDRIIKEFGGDDFE